MEDLSLFAKELNSLTRAEREQVLNDLHGVFSSTTTPAAVAARSRTNSINSTDLSSEGERIQAEALQGWNKQWDATEDPLAKIAVGQFPERVLSEAFGLMFLRAHDFHVEPAFEQLLRYFRQQQLLFGRHKVGKRIVLADLEEEPEDMRALKLGITQIMSSQDTAGRYILFDSPPDKIRHNVSPFSACRVAFFLTMERIESDIQTQLRGMVAVRCFYGQFSLEDFWFRSRLGHATMETVPLRSWVMHICLDFRLSLSTFLRWRDDWVHKDVRIRSRFHHGTLVECKYELMSYGIPVDDIPMESQGQGQENNSVRIKTRAPGVSLNADSVHGRASATSFVGINNTDTRNSGAMLPFLTINQPTPRDVLFGRGQGIQAHAGNVALNELIDSFLPQYNELGNQRKRKTALAAKIVASWKNEGGRFLVPGSDSTSNNSARLVSDKNTTHILGNWVEATDKAARTKVSHAFRSRRFFHKNNSSRTAMSAHISLTKSESNDMHNNLSTKDNDASPDCFGILTAKKESDTHSTFQNL